MNEVDNIAGSAIDTVLRLAADGCEETLNEPTAMLEKEPRLLLEAGHETRGGLLVTCTTILEFFITSLDPMLSTSRSLFFQVLRWRSTKRKAICALSSAH